jgi:hypothetical protein
MILPNENLVARARGEGVDASIFVVYIVIVGFFFV